MNNHTTKSYKSRVAACILIGLAANASKTYAGVISGSGSSAVVNQGDPVEDWTVTNGAALILNPGSQSTGIALSNYDSADGYLPDGGTLTANGAFITGQLSVSFDSTAFLVDTSVSVAGRAFLIRDYSTDDVPGGVLR